MKALLALLISATACAQEAPAPPTAAPAPSPPKPAETKRPAPTDESEFSPAWSAHWEVHAITLPASAARPILPELRDETKSAAGWTKVETLLAKKEAEVALETGAQALDGWGFTKFSQVEEIRYPVESERPEVEGSPKQELFPQTPAPAPAPKPGTPQTVRYPLPKFESRNVGYTLEVDVLVSADGQRLIVNSKLDHTWLLKWDEFEVGRLPNNEKIVFKQPRFAALKREGKSAMQAGERMLLSAHPVPGVEGKTELIFIHVWTTPRKAAGAK